ncbi:MAG: B12-binding domain-containing radical SAM protein [Promethearchaeota archaeon]
MKKIELLVVDCLTSGKGQRLYTRDFIGAGPRYIAGFIEDISNQQVHTTLIRGESILNENFNLEKFPILCVSSMTMDTRITQKIFHKWLKFHPSSSNRLGIIGGPISSDLKILNRIEGADLSIIGEGEIAMQSLFQKNLHIIEEKIRSSKDLIDSSWKTKLFSPINGISYKIKERIEYKPKKQNNEKKWFKSSSGYPNKLKSYKEYKSARIFVETLRGCSNFRRTGLKISQNRSCSNNPCNICRMKNFTTKLNCPVNIPPGCGFCSTINEFGYPKSREVKSIINEIKSLIDMGVSRIVLGGPDFLDFHREDIVSNPLIDPSNPEPNYKALEALIDNLISIDSVKNHDVQLFVENIKAVLCTDKALDLIAKIPKSIFSIGCETGSEEFSNLLGRPGSPKQSFNAVFRAIKRGIRVHVYFIHSLPGDKEEYTLDTLKLLKKFAQLEVEKITIYKYQELPGAPFYQIPRNLVHFDKKTLKNFNKIKRFVINYNRSQKQKMIGKIVKVFISESNMFNPNDAIGWILEGGPKITVKNAAKFIGTFCNVQISSVISDRLVEGTIIN